MGLLKCALIHSLFLLGLLLDLVLLQSYETVILLSSLQFPRVAFFLIGRLSAAAGNFEDYCDRAIYGLPSCSAYVALLYESPIHRSAGIFNVDINDHGFFPPFLAARLEFTIEQWSRKVTLPQLQQIRMSKCPVQRLIKSDRSFEDFDGDSMSKGMVES